MAEIECVRNGSVLEIKLNRPSKKNAVTDAMYHGLATALVAADADPDIAVVLIEGAGADFCAGNDLATLRDLASATVRFDELHSNDFLEALAKFGKPLLAGVTGHAIGIGATLLLHCDVVYAAQDARIVFPFLNMALVPEAGSAYLLPARIGYARAYALLCLSEPISGEAAASIGLITAACAKESVAGQIRAAAARLASKSVDALRATKILMRDQAAIEKALRDDQAAFLTRLLAPEVLALQTRQPAS